MPLLRITCAPTDTDHLVTVVLRDAGATEVVVVERASRASGGDVVLADVPRGAVDSLVRVMRLDAGPDLHHVTIQEAERLIPVPAPDDADEDAVVWSKVVLDVHQAARLSWINVLLVVVAACIGAVGIIQDQLLLIVGAMAISPDYYPVVDTCLAVVRRRWDRAGEGLRTLAVCFGAGALGAFLFTAALELSGLVKTGNPTSRQLTLFISHPDGLSVAVALLAGVAGALALTLPDGRGLVGVFVSITTIPAAANIGVALASADWGEAGGAALMLLVNVASLLVAGVATLVVRARFGGARFGPGVRALRPR